VLDDLRAHALPNASYPVFQKLGSYPQLDRRESDLADRSRQPGDGGPHACCGWLQMSAIAPRTNCSALKSKPIRQGGSRPLGTPKK
jgi:hypothetical protein